MRRFRAGIESAAALYGILAGSLRKPSPLYGLPFGAAVWVVGYVILPEAGTYEPIWEYDAKILAGDLSGYHSYGAGTGAAFWLFVSSGSQQEREAPEELQVREPRCSLPGLTTAFARLNRPAPGVWPLHPKLTNDR